MDCERCGRDNPEHLTFCRDCGNRLRIGGAAAPVAGLSGRPGGTQAANPGFAPIAPGRAVPAAAGLLCNRCGVANEGQHRFCSQCGADLAAAFTPPPPPQPAPHRACPRCGAPAAHHTRFCSACGADLAGPSARGGAAPSAPAAPIAPQPAPPAQLVVIAQDGSAGRSYVIENGQVDVGREEGDIRLSNDPFVSPRHARIHWTDGRFNVSDLGSVNGVYVRLRRPVTLYDASLVLVGLEVLRFELVSEAEKGIGNAVERGTQLFGSPATPRFARLCQRTVEGVTRDVFYLTRNETIIGRESGDIVFTSDPFMSRQHASISRDAGSHSYSLRDLGSSNGTYVAIRAIQPLDHFDHLRIGQHLFRLEVEGQHG